MSKTIKVSDFITKLNATAGINASGADSVDEVYDIKHYCSTGSILADHHLGGGLAYGRSHEIYGKQGSGKSTLGYQLARDCSNDPNGYVFWVATEVGSWDRERAKKFGLNMDKVVVSRPAHLGLLFAYIRTIINDIYPTIIKANGEAKILVNVDSLNACPDPALYKTGDPFSAGMANRQRVIGDFMKIIEIPIAKTNICLTFINQVAANIGAGFGEDKSKSAGTGNQLYHHVSTSLYLDFKKRTDSGQTIKFKLKKLRTEKPNTYWTTYMDYYTGVQSFREIYDIAVEHGLIVISGYAEDVDLQDIVPKKIRPRWQKKFAGYIETCENYEGYFEFLRDRVILALRVNKIHNDGGDTSALEAEYNKLVTDYIKYIYPDYDGQATTD